VLATEQPRQNPIDCPILVSRVMACPRVAVWLMLIASFLFVGSKKVVLLSFVKESNSG